MKAYEMKQRQDGRWEIIDQTKETPYPVGAMSWATEPDAVFLTSMMNEAFNNGFGSASQLKDALASSVGKQEARITALKIASQGREGWRADDLIAVASQLEKFILD